MFLTRKINRENYVFQKKMITFDQILYTTKINKKTIGKSIGSDHFCYQKMLQKNM